jgi:predicted RND superfamily exporter protein
LSSCTCGLVLAAKYESWKVPLAVVLIVPMCLLASVSGLMFHGMPIDILAQIGFVVLVGLAAKNAILIVEFARQHQEKGGTPVEATVYAAQTRLRPILMTSLAFILGVAPLVVATGAWAEMRQSLGTAVFGGMLGVTAFGLIFTPAFYTLVRRIRSGGRWAYDAACEVLRRAPGDQRCPPLVGGIAGAASSLPKKSGTFSRRCRDIGSHLSPTSAGSGGWLTARRRKEPQSIFGAVNAITSPMPDAPD